ARGGSHAAGRTAEGEGPDRQGGHRHPREAASRLRDQLETERLLDDAAVISLPVRRAARLALRAAGALPEDHAEDGPGRGKAIPEPRKPREGHTLPGEDSGMVDGRWKMA